jgi:cation diffusion facilitator family transporter
VGVAVLMIFARLQGGSASESKALMMSAVLSLLAGLSAAALLLESRAAQRARRQRLRHGPSKHEIVVAGAMSLVVIVGVVGLCGSLLHDLIHHRQHAPCTSGRWYGLIAVYGPWLVLLAASTTRKDSPQGQWSPSELLWHWKIDLLGSVVVFFALLVSRHDGFLLLDSLVALCCAAYAIGASSVALREAIRGLMDASVGDAETEVIRAAVKGVDGVRGVPSLVAIRCGRAIHVTAKVELAHTTRMGEAGRIRDLIAVAVEQQMEDVTEVLVELAPVEGAPEPSERGS